MTGPQWDECEHEWKVSARDFDGAHEEVECIKCGCPGERCMKSGDVYWPTT